MRVPYLVLFATLIPTLIAFYHVQKDMNAREQLRFDRIIAQTQTTVDEDIVRCIDQMYNMRALFAANQNAGFNEWKIYLNTMNLRHSELGIRTLGYIKKVTPATKEEFLKQMSADVGTNYTILPPGDRPIYFPMIYVTHFDTNAQAISGLDHAVRPERLKMIEQAVDQNKPFVTGRIQLMGADGMHNSYGTMIYLPVYKGGAPIDDVAQRQDSLQGVICITFLPQNLLNILFEKQNNPEVDIEVFDGTEADSDNLIYDSDGSLQAGKPKPNTTLMRRIVVPVLNRQWTFIFSTTPEFDANFSPDLQWQVLVGGLVFSFLLFGTVWMQVRTYTHAERLEVQLRQSQKMEAFGQLAAGVAHDFNNILTVIQGNLSLLQGGQLSKEEQSSALDHSMTAAERAANLTRQLLTFGRRQLMQPVDLDLNEVVANVTRMLQRLIGENITLETRLMPGSAKVRADLGMMEQVLMNLAINARDAMPKGGRLVLQTMAIVVTKKETRFKLKARYGKFIQLSVSDTGSGIASEHLAHIFEPFFTTKEVGKGTGLGLATVFGIIEQHHGWIEVESEKNMGTTFHIFLPRLAQSAEQTT